MLLLILTLSKPSIGVSVSYSDEDIKITVTRECIVTEECDFYTNLIKLQKDNKLPVDKKVLFEELKKQNCGWDDHKHAMGKNIQLKTCIVLTHFNQLETYVFIYHSKFYIIIFFS